MYLTSIKLAGFKSFVDPTKVTVRSNMTAIVGPNGCGKSNIVDAIRWVIGESSAKQLRGQSMSDVIFNGTTERKPVGRASVELHFDNSSGRIGGEYAKYAELVIRREVERDGQSEYYLNGTHCRRRDILDVFLGTGLGPRSYSIIEQGMISQLIEAKPEDMRVFFEEVAGISKYKERRRETENRIEHTNTNLARLDDIRQELDKQLRHLKRQANAAERYKTLKQEERELNAQIKALNWQSLEQKRLDFQTILDQHSLLREQKLADQRQFEAEIDKIKVQQDEAAHTQQMVQKRYYQVGEEIVRVEQQIKHHQEQIQRWQRELAEADQLWEELEEGAVEYREQIEELESELSSLTPQSGAVSEEVSQAQRALAEANAKMQAWQRAWDQFQQESAQISSQTQVTQTEINHQQQQLAQLKERQQTIEARLQQLPFANLHHEIEALTEQTDALRQQLNTSKIELETLQQQIAQQRETYKRQQQASQQQQRKLQALEAEHAKTTALQQAALGCNDESSANWLKQANLTTQSRLGQAITVEQGWEKAVETVLSGYFDAVCVENVEDYLHSLAHLTDGRITLIAKSSPLATMESKNFLLPLANQIHSDWDFTPWLQGVYSADSLAIAVEWRGQLAPQESIITRDGVWLGKNWIRVSNLPDSQRGILQREKLLQNLAAEIQAAREASTALEQQLKQLEAELNIMEQKRDQTAAALQKFSAELTPKQAQLSAKTTQLDNLRNDEKRLQIELNDIKQRGENTERQLITCKTHNEQLQTRLQAVSHKREELLRSRDQHQLSVENARQQAQKQQQHADELAIRLSANENQLALLRQTIQRSEKQLLQLKQRRDFLTAQLSHTDSPLEKLNQELQDRLAQRLTVENELKQAETLLAQLRHQLKELENAKIEVIDQINQLQAQIEEIRLHAQEVVVRNQTIKEQLLEIGFELTEVLAAMPAQAELAGWEERLTQLTQQIHRLGPINLAAIEEYQTSSERKEYLDKQYADLTESLQTLQAAIGKIDRESKTRFRDTFAKVNQDFQNIFPKVFGGGRASLELCENDLLKTGIIVRAQPPGKRNSTIHMLSGGEKALTAISLIFALFQLNPAPFCVLDEVDAPLDDLNVGRFCQLVKEMSKETQFLIISHNKVTIETADHLLGVTMQEAGVSRLVAVDVAEALEMVETA